MGYYFIPAKNEIILFSRKGEYHVKWNKSGLGRHLSHAFSHTLNQGWGKVKKVEGGDWGGGRTQERRMGEGDSDEGENEDDQSM